MSDSVRILGFDPGTRIAGYGIIDAAALEGGLGAGIYRPPMSVFSDAVAALDGRA